MLVTKDNLNLVLEELASAKSIAVDTETSGLCWYKDDFLFAVSIATKEKEYYIDFREDMPKSILKDLFSSIKCTIYMHNAKFDCHFLEKEGVELLKTHNVVCTGVLSRLDRNDVASLKLESLAKRLNRRKQVDEVKDYIKRNKLYKLKIKNKYYEEDATVPCYDKVPIEIMQPYAEEDARITYELGVSLTQSIAKQSMLMPHQMKLMNILAQELKLLPILYEMEKTGIKIDVDYTQKAYDFEVNRRKQAQRQFYQITGKIFTDSSRFLAPIFEASGYLYPRTEKGNPSFKQTYLEKMDNPLSKIVLEYRRAIKSANTYYGNFLNLADSEGIIHANINQSGTATGRFSYSDPNLQNLTKVEDESKVLSSEYLVRRCFVPREGYSFYMIDYDQMEYRLMLDYAGEYNIIEEVKAGKDIHQATADLMAVDRRKAKTLNFMLLYGGGVNALAEKLVITPAEARELRELYFSKLPKVSSLIKQIINKAEKYGYIVNCMGRKYVFEKSFEYKAPNYLIQGGCADIIKYAMLQIANYLKDKKSRMLVQVHDELLFEVAVGEEHIVPNICYYMQTAYKPKSLPLTVGVESSDKSWQDKVGVECHRSFLTQ